MEKDVDVAVDAAQTAFEDWSARGAGERGAYLSRFAALISRDAEELAQLEAVAMGKSVIPTQNNEAVG